MAENTRDLVVVITHGIDHELSSAGLTIACGGITAGLKVSYSLPVPASISCANARPT